MKTLLPIICLFVAGLFLQPVSSFACNKRTDSGKPPKHAAACSKAEKHTHHSGDHSNARTSVQSADAGCHTSSSDCRHGVSCKGKCKSHSCDCVSVCSAVATLSGGEGTDVLFFYPKKQLLPTLTETYFSSGFLSLWIPPKIG